MLKYHYYWGDRVCVDSGNDDADVLAALATAPVAIVRRRASATLVTSTTAPPAANRSIPTNAVRRPLRQTCRPLPLAQRRVPSAPAAVSTFTRPVPN